MQTLFMWSSHGVLFEGQPASNCLNQHTSVEMLKREAENKHVIHTRRISMVYKKYYCLMSSWSPSSRKTRIKSVWAPQRSEWTTDICHWGPPLSNLMDWLIWNHQTIYEVAYHVADNVVLSYGLPTRYFFSIFLEDRDWVYLLHLSTRLSVFSLQLQFSRVSHVTYT
jgi:hypothetical protein